MTSRVFRGIPSIQEVECSGQNLNSDVKLISLQLFRLPETSVLASLNVYTNNCMTFSEFSSCAIRPANIHQSHLRLLVHDLEEGEKREYGCTANTINPLGNSLYRNWKIVLTRNSKWIAIPSFLLFAGAFCCCGAHCAVCLFYTDIAVSLCGFESASLPLNGGFDACFDISDWPFKSTLVHFELIMTRVSPRNDPLQLTGR